VDENALHRRGTGNGLLKGSGVALDSKNFVLTASDVPSESGRSNSNNRSGRPLPLETSVLGVFASGDVRAGSVKRVGAAIGEGAVVGAELHTVLASSAPVPPRSGIRSEALGAGGNIKA
jgi:thioredoxin reductase (NADPH)